MPGNKNTNQRYKVKLNVTLKKGCRSQNLSSVGILLMLNAGSIA